MALEKYGNQILTSIRGRRLGLDHDDFLVGHSGQRDPYEEISAAGSIANSGLTVLQTTAAYAVTIGQPPAIGVSKTIVNGSTGGVKTVVRETGAVFISSLGDCPEINIVGPNISVQLQSISTTTWAPVSRFESTLVGFFSTST